MNDVNGIFSQWATGFSGCDGGDVGSPENQSIWFCGIEWGGGHPADEVELTTSVFSENVESPGPGYTSVDGTQAWRHNLAYIFNWQAMKLLTAINGLDVSAYKNFAEKVKPFTAGETGYFKMNLFPLAFKNTSHFLWESGFSKATGFAQKIDYLNWIRANRFPVMKSWEQTYRPKLILCVGISYLSDFKLAFVDDGIEFHRELIDDRELNWAINNAGGIVVVLPFMVNRNGLVKNVSIQKFGDRIRQLLADLNKLPKTI